MMMLVASGRKQDTKTKGYNGIQYLIPPQLKARPFMKLYQDKAADLNIVTGYAADHVLINKVRYDHNLIIQPAAIEPGWASGGFDALTMAEFERLATLGAEVVIIGTGARQRFPSPALLRPLMAARIGFEIMDLGSACRTYNILAGEGRTVAAALILDKL